VKAPPAATVWDLLRPRWLVLHLVLLGSAVAMVFLGRWQLQVSESNKYALQNVSYVVQWWVFAAFAVFFWARLVRDARRPPAAVSSPSGEVVLRSGSQAVARSGPANLVRTETPGGAPVAYRGYVLPDSAKSPHRSYGDDFHNSYNDYLWQLGLADQAEEPGSDDVR
jgi:DNA-binding transcriptional regulator of glucitol operon